MKKRILISLLLGTFSTVSVAADAEKMTYEKAMQSHKATYGKYSAQSITEQQSQLAWDSYKQKPEESAGGSATLQRTYKQLWKSSSTSGLNTGNVTLNESFRNFDEIVTIGSNDNGQYVQHYRFTPLEYDLAIENSSSGNATLYERDSVSWNGKFTTDTYFTTTGENSKIYAIYGVKFAPGSNTPSCTAGQTKTENVYCNSPQKTCEVGARTQTCSVSGDFTPWSITRAPICVSQTQQCP
ncbi:hypothetical protein [Shewanella xiamenensis]|uniref:hypothetical protein n=1 Tax=Shewanella xiamenensis TaxID=332186 RepID=UPI002179941F|nr:hypothetical protein [Shewanella xiamenensis]BDQ68656.1 hypothetical protein NUITMVS2_44690 [Shewanella xiamenensis]GLD78906.1 hypothetical protein NUITMVS3_33400 [Shewanella xiamenensis]